jgi:hypothetical protein
MAGQIEPLGVRALLLHAARDSGHARAEVGWGRLTLDVDAIASVGDGVARILYQGELRPGKYLRAALPRPEGGFIGDVSVSATFCFASPVDTQSPDLYTRAGLEVVFRPDLSVITLEAPKMVNLHQDILDAYPGVLLPIEPIVEIDLDA